MRRVLFAISLVNVGCEPTPAKVSDSAAPDDSGGCEEVDTAAHGTPVGLCADGGWGRFGAADGVIHVSPDGDDAATGHWWDPVATLDAALALSEDACDGRTSILLGPGEHPVHATISGENVAVYGCGVDATTLVDASGSPDYLVRSSGATGLHLADFSTSGGRRALRFEAGDATVENVTVSGSTRTGILGYGLLTLTLVDVWVEDPIAEDDVGFGISIQGADSSMPANLSMEGGGIVAAVAVGILADTTDVTLTDVSVSGTTGTSAGLLGRGLQLQTYASGALSGCSFSGNADAGIFAYGAPSLSLVDTDVVSTVTSLASESEATTTGDGVVAIRGDSTFPVSDFRLSVSGGKLDGNARAALLAEDVTVDRMEPESADSVEKVGDTSLLYQGTETVPAANMALTDELALNKDPFAADTPE